MKFSNRYFVILTVPFLGGFAAMLLRVIIAFSLRDAGATFFEITLLASSFMIFRALFSPIVGRLADYGFRRSYLMAGGFVGLLIDSQLYLHVAYDVIILLRIFDGIFSAMVWPTMQAVVHIYSEPSIKAKTMSLYFIMGSTGMSIGYLAYSYFIGNITYAILLIAVVYMAEIFTVLKVKNVGRKKIKILEKQSDIDVSLYVLTFLFGMYLSLGTEVILFYLAEILYLGRETAASVLFLAGILSLLGNILMGHIADRHGYRQAMVLLGITAPISAFLLSLTCIYISIVGVFLYFISARAFMPVSRSLTASLSAQEKIGVNLGYVNLFSNIGSVIGPLIGGYALDLFYRERILFFNASAIIFLAVAVAIITMTYVFVGRQEQ